MPRFYFDVREGSSVVPDSEGLGFDGIEDAEMEAAVAAAEMGRDELPNGDAREVTIEVRNEHRQRVLTMSVSP
jgi:hypothetical protein